MYTVGSEELGQSGMAGHQCIAGQSQRAIAGDVPELCGYIVRPS